MPRELKNWVVIYLERDRSTVQNALREIVTISRELGMKTEAPRYDCLDQNLKRGCKATTQM